MRVCQSLISRNKALSETAADKCSQTICERRCKMVGQEGGPDKHSPNSEA